MEGRLFEIPHRLIFLNYKQQKRFIEHFNNFSLPLRMIFGHCETLLMNPVEQNVFNT